jgi:hypothetical protein
MQMSEAPVQLAWLPAPSLDDPMRRARQGDQESPATIELHDAVSLTLAVGDDGAMSGAGD